MVEQVVNPTHILILCVDFQCMLSLSPYAFPLGIGMLDVKRCSHGALR